MNKVIQGNALEVLRTLPSEYVNCIVTSPPFWGLRDYGIDPIIWDGDPECEHEWTTKRTARPNSSGGKTEWAKEKLAIKGVDNYSEFSDYHDRATYNFCKCGAWKGSLGLEPTFELYIKHLCDIFDECKRVLRKDGTCWVNLGDSYGGNNSRASNNGRVGYGNEREGVFNKANAKSLCLIPFRFAIEMVNRGWICRNVIIWHKPNCMPSSAKDRFTVDFEYLFFFVKNKKYWFEQQFDDYAPSSDVRYIQALRNNKSYNTKSPYKSNTPYCKAENEIKAGLAKQYKRGIGTVQSRGNDADGLVVGGTNPNGRNKRTVWTIPTKPYPEAHFAVYPAELIRTCIQAGCPKGGTILDPFAGSGTTGEEAIRQGKEYLLIELKKEYLELIEKKLQGVQVNLI